MTLKELEGHSSVSELFKCQSSAFVHQFTRFQLMHLRRTVPQWQLCFLSLFTQLWLS